MSCSETRTSKSIRNSSVALMFFVCITVLNFVSRKVFLDHLGLDVLGMNTTAANFLSFLNLAELGVGAAVASTLYKPLGEGNQQQVCEIVSLQGWLYRRIAICVGVGGCVLMCFFPLIFAKISLPLWYAYGSFGVLLFGALFGYFANYRQVLLSADQKEYKVSYSYRPIFLLKILGQILAVKYFSNGYIWWLILELVFVFVVSFTLNRTINKEYPYLSISASNGKQLRHKYPEILTKIKQLFFHRVSLFALQQTSLLVIYAYASLSMVAIYGNYMLIVSGITGLLVALFNIDASVGNLVAEGDKTRILKVFYELFSVRFMIVVTICFCVYRLSPQFISLWVGKEYVLDNGVLALIVMTMYISLSRSVVDVYLAAYGLFKDIWAPITETVLNIGLSVLLGYFYGLYGILSGVLISQIVIALGWKPYFLYRSGFKEAFAQYWRMYLIHIITAVIVILISWLILGYIEVRNFALFYDFLIDGLSTVVVFAGLFTVALFAVSQGFRDFVRRAKRLVKI